MSLSRRLRRLRADQARRIPHDASAIVLRLVDEQIEATVVAPTRGEERSGLARLASWGVDAIRELMETSDEQTQPTSATDGAERAAE